MQVIEEELVKPTQTGKRLSLSPQALIKICCSANVNGTPAWCSVESVLLSVGLLLHI